MGCVRIGTALRWKKFQATPQKTGSLYLLRILFKISDEHPRSSYIEVPGGGI